ncbi:SDR family oxidoreductase [Myxacorys almedinensis]|uniref:SDR family NAD(P)-dependent oxidoreductase n=1 Tax=Myxacorys almedinensis A TaxID=2690445 RepID=A0A8J7Z2J2_9CYAN|nr:SDR family oxidoreductase [Myxacorys almedinensis]NDJ18504.1 SDR family NAD(P)-dependent oxidoreductase [Myxacorys almedinensis A]
MNLKPIDQQVVAVMGASSGIGRDAALRFAQKGAKVVVSARSQEGLMSLVEEIRQAGGDAIAIPADVAQFEQVKDVADKTVEHFGRLDTWVHVAATGMFATFDSLTPEEFKRVIDVNLMGQVYGAMAALPHLKREGRGSLIHITSVEARRTVPFQSAYASSKHGVEGFIDAMRLELKHEGYQINVANILPAVINTPFYNKGKTKLGVKPTGIPPYYNPSLVSDAILYASEHEVRDYIVGDIGRILDIAQKISPALVDAGLLLIGFKGQKTQEFKAEEPNNLYEPIEGFDRVEGDFKSLEIPSFLDAIDKNPAATFGALAIAVLGGLALLGGFGGER